MSKIIPLPEGDVYECTLAVHDSLQDAGVYVNSDGEIRHMDAYRTITNYEKLQTWWDQHKNDYATDKWLVIAEQESYFAYLSPNASQLASFIQRKLGDNFKGRVS